MFDKELFAKLLELAKGEDRSINKYAADCGISSAHISRLIRGLIDTPPGPTTIKKFADYSKNNVTYEQLMKAAGFTEEDTLEISDLENLLENIRNIESKKDIIALKRKTPDFELKIKKIREIQQREMNSLEERMDSIDKAKFVQIPVLGVVKAGLPLIADENLVGYFPTDKQFILNGRDYFYLRVKGDSMDKEFKEDSLVLVQKQDHIETGEIGVVLVNGYEATVKRIFIKDSLITLMPQSNNTEHLPQIYDTTKEEVRILGKVILAVKKY